MKELKLLGKASRTSLPIYGMDFLKSGTVYGHL
nr:MAG TPA_asm: hypothetical protein [Caudoviricetes sp.]